MQDLGLVGIRDMGNYDPSERYQRGHFVYYEGSTYKVLRDNIIGITPSDDGVNYGFLARGFVGEDANEITITDTYGEIVNAGEKTLVQRIIDHIISSFVKKEDLSSSGTVTTPKQYAADAWQLNPDNEGSYAKSVASQIDDLATKPSVPTTGFTFEDYGSFKTGNIQYIKCRIALGALYSGYVPILNNPTLAKNPFIAHVSVEHASKIFNSVIRVTQMQTELFYTEEIRALGNTTINVYVDTFYEIKRE